MTIGYSFSLTEGITIVDFSASVTEGNYGEYLSVSAKAEVWKDDFGFRSGERVYWAQGDIVPGGVLSELDAVLPQLDSSAIYGVRNTFSGTSCSGQDFPCDDADDLPATWNWQFQITAESATAQVPVPATLALMGLGLAGLGWKRRKQS
jgi:hypothetical protein